MSVTTDRDERLLIGGEWVAGGDGGYEIVNPATEDVVGVAPEASVQQARDAARAARDAFESWSQTTPEQRAELLSAAAVRVREKLEDFVPLVIAETGCTTAVGRAMQVPVAASRFDRYARGALEPNVIPLAPQEMPATPMAPAGLMGALARRAPVGVVACITPYNFPIVNMAGKIGPALAMGNTVIVRPAPQDPLAVIELVRERWQPSSRSWGTARYGSLTPSGATRSCTPRSFSPAPGASRSARASPRSGGATRCR